MSDSAVVHRPARQRTWADHPVPSTALGAREAMIVAAEQLFGEQGIAAVSMRQVAAAAGQGNTSAVRYHFGSRDGLVSAIFAYRMARIDERRRAIASTLGLGGTPPDDVDLRSLVEALVLPLAESIGHDGRAGWYMRFLRQVVFMPDVDLFAPPLTEVTGGLRTVVGAIVQRLAHLPPTLRNERIVRATELMVHALADHEALLAAGRARMATAALTADLVDTALGVLEAVPSAGTIAALDRSRSSDGQVSQAPPAARRWGGGTDDVPDITSDPGAAGDTTGGPHRPDHEGDRP